MENYINLYENYKETRKLEEADLSRFEGRLGDREIEELKKQILYLVLEAEEEAFLSALKYQSAAS